MFSWERFLKFPRGSGEPVSPGSLGQLAINTGLGTHEEFSLVHGEM